ncbi:TonB-dependent receptor plug domain-containing protein [Horticoccus sp. 23ND18S-11]|uniref:TonB-dependent receptor plug domain-containing protein n=1 Tax=Horticoccus sp. 23ND18S-11 TaxID=3391832 RepID=UPI0039C9A864
MNTPVFRSDLRVRCGLLLATVVLLFAAHRATAQAVAPKPDNATTPGATGDAAIRLTPFTVNTDRDTGFAAASALAGGRLATDLRDTPAAYSVINRDFIDALNLTDLQQAQNWATGSTFQSDIGTFNFTTFTVRYNSRGVSAGQQLRNFFPVNGDNDSYALERYDFGRGANSILFGNGSLGGVSSSTTKRARTDRAFQDVKLSTGSWDLMRATIDVNQPIGDKVAARVAAVGQNVNGWRQKEFDQRRGIFLTTTARPFRNTEIRVEAEAINRKINAPINNLQDQLSGWNGITTFDRPAALATATAAEITALQAQGVGRRAANYNVYDPYNGFHAISSYTNEAITLGGGTTATTPIGGFVSGSNAAFGLTNTNLLYAMNVPDNRFDTLESRSYFRRPSRRFSINQDGPLLETTFRDVQATIEQRLGDFYFELAGDINKNSNYTNGEQNRGANATYLDINRVLPNGQPNAHYLQAYGDGNFFRGFRHYDFHNVRFAAAWKKDTRFGNFAINTMVGENKNHYTLSYQWLSLAQGTNTLAWLNGTTSDIKIRRYWNEPSRPFVDLAGKEIPYYDPTSRTTTMVTPRWVIDHTRFDSESINDANYRYGLVALNAKFWKDRIILLGAVRRDRYFSQSQQMAVNGDYPTDRDPLVPFFKPLAPKDFSTLTYIPVDAQGRPQPEVAAVTRPRLTGGVRDPRYTQYRFQDDYNAPALEGYQNTKSVGTVVHLFSWLNPSVNYAETFNPQKAYALLQGGGLVPPTVSKGWNYSTRFEFFQRKLDVNFTYYTSEEINNPQSVSGFPFNTLLQATPVGTTQDLNKRGIPLFIAGSDVQDRHAKGYEVEFTANVVKGLRIIGSASLPDVYGSNAFQLTRAYFEKNADNFKVIAQDAGAKIDASNVATVDTGIPADIRPDAQIAADAYNTIVTAYRNLNINRSTGVNQPLYKFFGDYTVQAGKFKGVRLGAGVQYRGREIIGNRGADTIVDPNNPTRAIDDPSRSVNTPLYTPEGDTTVTATFGYLWRFKNHNVQLQLVINNLLNDKAIYWTSSTNGTATTALRPRDGDYRSPARETVPVGFGQKTPINFNLSASWRM